MKKRVGFLVLLLVVLCSVTFSAFAEDQLAEIKKSGVLNFGTSPDYIPFVFYDDSGILTGIDVELMNEIGRRMGVSVKKFDMAFDGLLDAVDIGQVDIVGGGLSKTDYRAEKVDFTRVYYAGDAEIVVLSGYPVPQNVTLEDFRDRKIGVQRGTSFDQWIKSNLVSGGFISTRNVFVYDKLSEAVIALNRGDIDMTMMDQDTYEKVYKNSGKYKLYYQNFAKENFAFAVKKGSTLLEVVNGHLTDMIKDGTAQQIADKFFKMSFDEIQPSIARPGQAATPVPLPTSVAPVPAQCVNAMSFVSDVTITDGHEVKPNERFTKTWRIYNNGSCSWNPGYSFVYVNGDLMGGQNVVINNEVKPGQTYDVSVPFTAPSWEGTFKSNWQMRSPQGQNFGQTLWVKVRVRGNAPAPTAKPRPTAQPKPTSGPGPQPTQVPVTDPPIIRFFAPDYYAGTIMDCPMVYWSAVDTDGVEIFVDDISVVSTTDWDGAGYYCNWNGAGTHTFEMLAYNDAGIVYSQFEYQSLPPLMPTETPKPAPVNPPQEPTLGPVYPTQEPMPGPVYPDDEDWTIDMTDEELNEVLDNMTDDEWNALIEFADSSEDEE